MGTDNLSTLGIVLGETKVGESSKYLTVYTQKAGKMSLMAKGAFRRTSPLVSVSQRYAESKMQIATGRPPDPTCYLRSGKVLFHLLGAGSGYRPLLIAGALGEVVIKSMEEGEPQEKVYDLLSKTLRLLSTDENPDLIFAGFLIKFLTFIGYRPILHQCVECGKEEDLVKFSPALGGVLCAHCNDSGDSTSGIYTMEQVLYTSLDQLHSIEGVQHHTRSMILLMLKSLEHHLDLPAFHAERLFL